MLRFRLGLALGRRATHAWQRVWRSVHRTRPDVVVVPAGAFRMGTSAADAAELKAQETRFWPDEQPDHIVTLTEFSIGKYPVTNAEFRCFLNANGCGDPDKENPGCGAAMAGAGAPASGNLISRFIQRKARRAFANG